MALRRAAKPGAGKAPYFIPTYFVASWINCVAMSVYWF